ncbi:spore gernimation protein [Bacillus salacetis]|uniref:Spore gernimation protein n=1 Tax=Bacillus salacetis TaxID=2315464 RepID=A0A3A1R193_9BACI|nr:spore germination protein GerPB [Bacillus salacetis]RIW35308.1 spore gernimation protein [Bacillus salacetis]
MKLYVQQSIHIRMISIGGMSNSSVFQIGTSGQISSSSHLYNTGGFVEPAPEPVKPGSQQSQLGDEIVVPLASPTPG